MKTKAVEKLIKRSPALYAVMELDKGLKTFPLCTLVAAVFTFIL